MLERDGVTDSMKYMTIEKELSHDDNGQTPIINKRRSKFHGSTSGGLEGRNYLPSESGRFLSQFT